MATSPPTGATAFDGIERAYERVRPTYAIDAILAALLLAGCGDVGDVADLAAGTGKLTRLLVPHASTIVAIEPSPAMRRAFQLALPDVEIVDGRAEEIPLPDASLDLVTVGEAFHWFRPAPAIAEIGRVLRPGGALVIAFNEWRTDAAPWLRNVFSRERSGRRVRRPGRNWRRTLEQSELFDGYCEAARPHEQQLTPSGFVDLVRSMSHVNALDEDARAAYVESLRLLVDEQAPTPLIVPIRTRAFAARRRG
ncbi:MAG TPA: class I SAM-dependent methyltransferase [Gaiellales bacterium]|jgi:SAM-dependent methyltransferase